MVIVRIWEGLGNQMFQYAYARGRLAQGIAVSLDLNKAYVDRFPTLRNNSLRINSIQNFNLVVPSTDVEAYGKYFYLREETQLEKAICCLAKRGLWKYSFLEEESEFYSCQVAHLKGDVYVKGWFQDVRYFSGIRKELLREFTPKKKIRIPQEVLKMVQRTNSVAIHVRRGDYVRLGRALPAAYYIKAKREIEKRMTDPVYLVFSDDSQWVKDNIEWGCKVFYVEELCCLEDYEQLFVMSRCRAQITANSTFSWWAAWLNPHSGKIVVMPRKFLNSEPGLRIDGSVVV